MNFLNGYVFTIEKKKKKKKNVPAGLVGDFFLKCSLKEESKTYNFK
jgi:hypothetical protein